MKGDLAESFSFATLFPTVLQPGVSVISNTIFMVLISCKVCTRPVQKYDIGAPAGITISVPGTESQDAERRRQIALRALSERLTKAEPFNEQWPSLNEPDKEDNTAEKGDELRRVNEIEKDLSQVQVQMY